MESPRDRGDMQEEKRLPNVPRYDARFPAQNQMRACWQNYVDFFKCREVKGEDYEPCFYFQQMYKSLCISATIARWDEQREIGTFPAKRINAKKYGE